MLKPRIVISNTILCLLVASGCHRLPLSLGDGVDMWDDPGGSGTAGSSSSGGAAGAPGSAGTSAGVGGGPALSECDTTYQLCLESGEWPETCRDGFARCEGSGSGTAGTGAGGEAGSPGVGGAGGYGSGGAAGAPGLDECDTTYVLCLESGEPAEICREELSRCEQTETGAAGTTG